MKKKALIILGVLLALVPLGLLSENPAWGEWNLNYYKEKLGFIPKGMEQAAGLKPIIPDYEIPGLGSISGYYVSAIVGIVLIFAILFIIGKILKRKSNEA